MRKSALSVRFGLVLRKRRIAVGLTQEELAHRAELHATYVSMLERGLNAPSLNAIERLAKSLGTTMTDLIRELEKTS